MATLFITVTENYSDGTPPVPANTTSIVFNTAGSTFATFAATQFGGNPISDTVSITGDGFNNTLIINLNGIFSAAGWTFTSWASPDVTIFAGSANADTITGTSKNDIIAGEGGADTLSGGEGDDEFQYFPASELEAGESLDGGGGTDSMSIGGGSYNFSGHTIINIEKLFFSTSDGATVTLDSNHIGTGAITNLHSNNGSDNVIVNGTNVDLFPLTFGLWVNGTDTITINGTSTVANTLVGSSKNDTINGLGNSVDTMTGGGGADILNGGNFADTFRYLAGADAVAGEVINAGVGAGDSIELVNTGAIDFTNVTLNSVERLVYASGTSTATFGANFGFGFVVGSAGVDGLIGAGASINFSGANFSSWTDGTDTITINGTSGEDSLTGSAKNDTFFGAAGGDLMTGGAGDDVFLYTASNEIAAGEAANGGAGGTDVLRVAGSGSYNFGTVALTSIEGVIFTQGAGQTATAAFLPGEVIGTDFTTITGGAGIDVFQVDTTGNVDLSALGFGSWTAGTDRVVLNGGVGDQTLTGASQGTTFTGGGGSDIMTGGDGDDVFVYSAPSDVTGDSVTGGGGTDGLRLDSSGTFDFSNSSLNVERIVFNQAAGQTATAQFSSPIPPFKIVGGAGIDILQVSGLTNNSLGGLTFDTWTDGVDLIFFNGGSGNQTLTGSSRNDIIDGQGGNNTLSGGGGDDTFILSGTSIAQGIDGGTGTDTIEVSGGSHATGLSNVEALRFTAAATMTVGGSAIGSGANKINAITGSAGINAIVINSATSVNLSTLAFTSWTNGTDTITINGTAAANSLIGSSQNDIINGGAGNDGINGGAGFDRADYTGARASYNIVRLSGGEVRVADTRGGNPDGFDNVAKIEQFQFGDGVKSLAQVIDITDFNIFWHQTSTNAWRDWTVSFGAVAINLDIGAPAAFDLKATGDFNADGVGDGLWFNSSNGEMRTIQYSASGIASVNVIATPPAGWSPIGSGDFNGDGTSDLIVEDFNTGRLHNWTMQNGTISSDTTLGALPPEWRMIGTGDFNGDGAYDIFWRNISTGEIREWTMANGALSNNIVVGALPLSWGIAATGDFNHDNTADIIWRDTATGDTRLWLMANGAVANSLVLPALPPEWKLIAAGDYDQNGHDDLLWQNSSTGQVREWLLNNGAIINNIILGTTPTDFTTAVNASTHTDFLPSI